MEIAINKFPSFLIDGAKIAAEKGEQKANSLTISELEKLQKCWLFEVLKEFEKPEEYTQLFYTRQQAIERLSIGISKFQNLEKAGLLKRNYLGPMPVYFEADLLAAITKDKQK